MLNGGGEDEPTSSPSTHYQAHLRREEDGGGREEVLAVTRDDSGRVELRRGVEGEFDSREEEVSREGGRELSREGGREISRERGRAPPSPPDSRQRGGEKQKKPEGRSGAGEEEGGFSSFGDWLALSLASGRISPLLSPATVEGVLWCLQARGATPQGLQVGGKSHCSCSDGPLPPGHVGRRGLRMAAAGEPAEPAAAPGGHRAGHRGLAQPVLRQVRPRV